MLSAVMTNANVADLLSMAEMLSAIIVSIADLNAVGNQAGISVKK
jgi:hypothetical protein